MKKLNLIRTHCYRANKICSKQLFADQFNHIKLILNKAGYPQEDGNKITN